ncbi:HAD family hydrolase [Demequina rhizosphaerae]|uniref:HAD family hydrolase n=1 Tax=Demequina rhizosphaerae TaxID=1638985 RepID=UPI000780EFFD|nr:HAD family hydrolase [Demequina rhizosphaerae]
MTPTVIFDFDGTLALGDGPLHAYAACVAEAAGVPGAHDAYAAALASHEAGEGGFRDGYHAVQHTALSLGVAPDALQEGYVRSRALLAGPDAPIAAPPGLGDFLARLAEHAELVLVTNSPPIRIDEALGVLGAAPHLDRVLCSAGKPDGMPAIVADALTGGPVLSVGDIYAYDLEPAARLGADTAAVGPGAAAVAHLVTMAAPALPALYGEIEAWAAAASSRR